MCAQLQNRWRNVNAKLKLVQLSVYFFQLLSSFGRAWKLSVSCRVWHECFCSCVCVCMCVCARACVCEQFLVFVKALGSVHSGMPAQCKRGWPQNVWTLLQKMKELFHWCRNRTYRLPFAAALIHAGHNVLLLVLNWNVNFGNWGTWSSLPSHFSFFTWGGALTLASPSVTTPWKLKCRPLSHERWKVSGGTWKAPVLTWGVLAIDPEKREKANTFRAVSMSWAGQRFAM